MRFITTKFSDFPTHLIVIRLHLVAHGNRIRRAIRQRRVRDARVIDFAPEDAGGGVKQIFPVIDPAIQVGFARGGVKVVLPVCAAQALYCTFTSYEYCDA